MTLGAAASLLLLLGEAQRKANDFPSALGHVAQRSRDCAEAPFVGRIRAGRPGVRVYGMASRPDRPAARRNACCKRRWPASPRPRSRCRSSSPGGWHAHGCMSGAVSEAKALASRAIATARELGDPAALAISLSRLADFAWEPHETEAVARRARARCWRRPSARAIWKSSTGACPASGVLLGARRHKAGGSRDRRA